MPGYSKMDLLMAYDKVYYDTARKIYYCVMLKGMTYSVQVRSLAGAAAWVMKPVYFKEWDKAVDYLINHYGDFTEIECAGLAPGTDYVHIKDPDKLYEHPMVLRRKQRGFYSVAELRQDDFAYVQLNQYAEIIGELRATPDRTKAFALLQMLDYYILHHEDCRLVEVSRAGFKLRDDDSARDYISLLDHHSKQVRLVMKFLSAERPIMGGEMDDTFMLANELLDRFTVRSEQIRSRYHIIDDQTVRE